MSATFSNRVVCVWERDTHKDRDGRDRQTDTISWEEKTKVDMQFFRFSCRIDNFLSKMLVNKIKQSPSWMLLIVSACAVALHLWEQKWRRNRRGCVPSSLAMHASPSLNAPSPSWCHVNASASFLEEQESFLVFYETHKIQFHIAVFYKNLAQFYPCERILWKIIYLFTCLFILVCVGKSLCVP